MVPVTAQNIRMIAKAWEAFARQADRTRQDRQRLFVVFIVSIDMHTAHHITTQGILLSHCSLMIKAQIKHHCKFEKKKYP